MECRRFALVLLLAGIGSSIGVQPLVAQGGIRSTDPAVRGTEGRVPSLGGDTLTLFTPLESDALTEWSGVECLEVKPELGFERVGPLGLLLGGALGGFAAWSEHGDGGFCGAVESACPLTGQPGHGSVSEGGSGNRASTALLLGGVSAAMGALLGAVSPDRGHHHARIEPYLTIGPAGGWFAGARVCLSLSDSRLLAFSHVIR